jgi:hypothetical protein
VRVCLRDEVFLSYGGLAAGCRGLGVGFERVIGRGWGRQAESRGVGDFDCGGGGVAPDLLDTFSRARQAYASVSDLQPEQARAGEGARSVVGGAGQAADVSALEGFERSAERFCTLVGWLAGEQARDLEHSQLEARLAEDGRELIRLLLQDHLDLRAVLEPRVEGVVGADGVRRSSVERSHERELLSVFGEVEVGRLAYRARGWENLYPADAQLNLPVEKHSHGMRRLAALEAPRSSFEDAQAAILRQTGQRLGKRQLRELAVAAAGDFKAFYEQRERTATEQDDVLVLSCDGKGVVMRQEALRDQTRKQAKSAKSKLQTRLSKGEKRARKRMAEVAAVYEVQPAPRTPADILPRDEAERAARAPAPNAKNKWLSASLSDEASQVMGEMFSEADRRDPSHARTWVALVDGNNHQINRIKAEARRRKLKVRIIVDFVHVLEYLWSAAWCFFTEGDPAAERWVQEKAREILAGKAGIIAASIRRKATRLGLESNKREGADRCADYLLAKRPHLDYPTALKQGWPIATGVIEGACRHLVKDRMDITGARWGLQSAEAVLKLRALITNHDFDQYWTFHLAQERRRVHARRYALGAIPQPT